MEEKKETICALKTFSILKGDCLGSVSYTHLTLPTTPYV